MRQCRDFTDNPAVLLPRPGSFASRPHDRFSFSCFSFLVSGFLFQSQFREASAIQSVAIDNLTLTADALTVHLSHDGDENDRWRRTEQRSRNRFVKAPLSAPWWRSANQTL
jgi:hypothetical protein